MCYGIIEREEVMKIVQKNSMDIKKNEIFQEKTLYINKVSIKMRLLINLKKSGIDLSKQEIINEKSILSIFHKKLN